MNKPMLKLYAAALFVVAVRAALVVVMPTP